jgi:hypothetical protein
LLLDAVRPRVAQCKLVGDADNARDSAWSQSSHVGLVRLCCDQGLLQHSQIKERAGASRNLPLHEGAGALFALNMP